MYTLNNFAFVSSYCQTLKNWNCHLLFSMVLFGQVINICYIQTNQYCIKMLEMRWKDKKNVWSIATKTNWWRSWCILLIFQAVVPACLSNWCHMLVCRADRPISVMSICHRRCAIHQKKVNILDVFPKGLMNTLIFLHSILFFNMTLEKIWRCLTTLYLIGAA